MAKRRIRTIAGLQRSLNAHNRLMAAHYRRRYVFDKAIAIYATRLDQLAEIDDEAEHFLAFRNLPAFEADLDAIYRDMPPETRLSRSQQDRAKHPRAVLTKTGDRIEDVVRTLLEGNGDPWRKKAKQFWQPLLVRLRQLGLKPSVIRHPGRPARERIEYQFGAKRRSLSEGQLANIISKLRRHPRPRTLH
jgi:hypothetical protein